MLRSAMVLFLGPVLGQALPSCGSEACDEVPDAQYTNLLQHESSLVVKARGSRAQKDRANSTIADRAFCNAGQVKLAKYWATKLDNQCDPRAGL